MRMRRFLLVLFIVIFTISIILIGVGCKEEATESDTRETTTTEEVTQESKEPEISDTADTTPPIKELKWRWQNPLPDGNTLNSVWCSSPTDVFAVGVNGTIKHYDGSTWSEIESGMKNNLNRVWNKVWGSSSSDVFVVGESYDYTTKQYKSVILHYNGSSWQDMECGISEYYLQDIWGSSSTDVFVSGGNGSQGIILHYNGSTWSVMTDQLSSNVSSIWGTSSSDVFAVSNKYDFDSQQYTSFIYHYNGESWSEMARSEINDDMRGDTLRDIWGTSSTDVYAVGERIYKEDTESHNAVTSIIYHYDGKSWSSTTSVIGRLYGVWGTSSSNVFAVMGMQGKENILLHYDGSTWSTIEHEFGNYLLGVHGTLSSDIFMVGYGGLIFHYDGKEWNQMSGFGTTINYINNIWGSSSTDVYAVGGRWDYPEQKYHSMMLHYDGESWNQVESETDRYNDTESWGTYIYDIWGTSSTDIFYVGRGGIINHYNGISWTQMNSGVEIWIRGIWGSSSSDAFAVGQNGLILHFDGNSDKLWTPMISGTAAYLFDVWGSSSSDVFAVGGSYDSTTQQSYPIILHYDGTSWSEMDAGITVGSLSGVGGSSSSNVFAVGGGYNYTTKQYESVILYYNGSSWSKMDNEALAIRTLNGVWGSSSSDLYAVGQLGSILHYDGDSWSEIVSSTSISFSAIWGTSSTDIFATTGQDGTILHYSN